MPDLSAMWLIFYEMAGMKCQNATKIPRGGYSHILALRACVKPFYSVNVIGSSNHRKLV